MNDKVEVDVGETGQETEEQDYRVEKRPDTEAIYEALSEWLAQDKSVQRLDFILTVLFHTFIAAITKGVWLAFVLAYYAFRFKRYMDTNNVEYMKTYRVEIEEVEEE